MMLYDDFLSSKDDSGEPDVGKSVAHLHYHLIPEMKIGALEFNGKGRKMISDGVFARKVEKFREEFIKKKV